VSTGSYRPVPARPSKHGASNLATTSGQVMKRRWLRTVICARRPAWSSTERDRQCRLSMVAGLQAHGPPVCTRCVPGLGAGRALSRGSSREGMATASRICPTATMPSCPVAVSPTSCCDSGPWWRCACSRSSGALGRSPVDACRTGRSVPLELEPPRRPLAAAHDRVFCNLVLNHSLWCAGRLRRWRQL
jgi:hypothetical protein